MYRERRRFWWGNLRERGHLEDPDADGRKILKCIFKKCNGSSRTGMTPLRKVKGGGLW
jgi:hypothetical protein